MPVDERLIAPLRELCLAYPDVEEQSEGTVGDPVFKTGGRIFAMQHGVDGKPSVWFKAPAGVQEAMIASNPLRAFRPPYVGHNGWVGAWLDDDTDWNEVADLLDDAWRMTAKKTVIRRFDAERTAK